MGFLCDVTGLLYDVIGALCSGSGEGRTTRFFFLIQGSKELALVLEIDKLYNSLCNDLKKKIFSTF